MSIRNETEYIEGLTDKRNPRGLDNINYAPIQHTGKGNRGNKNYRWISSVLGAYRFMAFEGSAPEAKTTVAK